MRACGASRTVLDSLKLMGQPIWVSTRTRHLLAQLRGRHETMDDVVRRLLGTTRTGSAMTEWLRWYLQDHPPAQDWGAALTTSKPYYRDGALWIVGKDLLHWLQSTEIEALGSHQMGRLLRLLGWTAATHTFRGTSRYAWRHPVPEVRQPVPGGPG